MLGWLCVSLDYWFGNWQLPACWTCSYAPVYNTQYLRFACVVHAHALRKIRPKSLNSSPPVCPSPSITFTCTILNVTLPSIIVLLHLTFNNKLLQVPHCCVYCHFLAEHFWLREGVRMSPSTLLPVHTGTGLIINSSLTKKCIHNHSICRLPQYQHLWPHQDSSERYAVL